MQALAVALRAALVLQGFVGASAQFGASQVASAAFSSELLVEYREEKAALGHAPAARQEAPAIEHKPSPDVHHKSWLERLGDALWGLLAGLFIVIPFSIALLWVNERRSAQLESILGHAKAEAMTIFPMHANLPGHDGSLVHISSEATHSTGSLRDQRFPEVGMDKGCLKLKSTVEVYQWQERKSESTQRDSVGGGETTVVSYSYDKEWCSSAVDSSGFHEKDDRINTVYVRDLEMGTYAKANPAVKYGETYDMPEELVNQLDDFVDAFAIVGREVRFNNFVFARKEDDWYYCQRTWEEPTVGDVRVKFEYVLDGPVTILALQVGPDVESRTFGPYRGVSRGLCTKEEELKERRVEAARQAADAIYRQDKCWDCCVCCNVVNRCFAALMVPQVFRAWHGQKDLSECLAAEEGSACMTKWGLRAGGWLLLFLGHLMVLSPLGVIVDIIPFAGIYISSALSYGAGFVAFFLTLFDASLIVAVAYTVYHPRLAAIGMTVCLGVLGVVAFLSDSHVHSA